MTDRTALLRGLGDGDIFHAESPNGASLICLVLAVTDDTIHAWRMLAAGELAFDRRTGIAEWGASERVPCTIDSIAPLPDNIHHTLVALDERYRLGQDPDRFKLTDAEKQALLFVDTFYASHRI